MKASALVRIAVAALSSLCLVVALAGCQDTPAPSSDPESQVDTQTSPDETDPTEAPTEPTDAPTTPPTSSDSEGTTNETEPTDTPTEPTTPDPTDPVTPPASDSSIASVAQQQLGKAYRLGAAGPDEFDNSGLVYYCLKQVGITAPRKTSDLYQGGASVSQDELQPGDLVFFWNDTEGTAQYVGIYIGDHQFISSDNEEKPVVTHDMSLPYFQSRFVGAKRYS